MSRIDSDVRSRIQTWPNCADGSQTYAGVAEPGIEAFLALGFVAPIFFLE